MIFDAVFVLLLGIALIAFVALKVANVIKWPWGVVLLPLGALVVLLALIGGASTGSQETAIQAAGWAAGGVGAVAFIVWIVSLISREPPKVPRRQRPSVDGHREVASILRGNKPPVPRPSETEEVVQISLTKDEASVAKKLLSRLEQASISN